MENKIDFSAITACGECCITCKKKVSGLCQGCIESDGYCKEWAQTGRCPVYTCAKLNNVQFCGICPQFPCSEVTTKIHWKPNIVNHLTTLAKLYREQTSKVK